MLVLRVIILDFFNSDFATSIAEGVAAAARRFAANEVAAH